MKETLSFKQLEQYSLNKIERLQRHRFRATCAVMLPNVPAYARMFRQHNVDPAKLKKIEDWRDAGLPLIKKATYMKKPFDYVVQVSPREAFDTYFDYLYAQRFDAGLELWVRSLFFLSRVKNDVKSFFMPKMPAFSGGTESGKPTPVLLTGKQKKNLHEILATTQELIAPLLPKNKTGMNLFPYAPHLGWHAVHIALDIAADLNLHTAAGGVIPTAKLAEMAKEFKPTIFAGMGDYIRNRFLIVLQKEKIRLQENVLFINGATKLYDAERKQIREAAKSLGAKAEVIDFFGASELKEDIMPECRPFSGFHHIAPLSNIIKTVNVERVSKEFITEWDFAENGYLATWNIDGAGTLLEGYVLGDTVERVEREKCKNCGLNVERFFNISRIKEAEAQLKLTGMIEEKVKGSRINLTALRDGLLGCAGVKEAQIILRKSALTVNIALNSIAGKRQAMEFLKKLEVTPRVRFISLEKLLGENELKFKGIIIER